MAQAGQTILDIKNLSVSLPKGGDRSFAVRNVDIRVDAGEIVCVVGESGSGKSVTALTVMGLLEEGVLIPTQGSVLLEGEEIIASPNKRLRELRGMRMGMIFQEPMTALNPVMRVGDQIAEVVRVHHPTEKDALRKRILAILNDVRLPDPKRLITAYPHQLSGGQRQRIVIAMALIMEPRLLIADEPTTALDVTTQKNILSLIREIQRKRGMGVLFITHDFGVVSEIADRVAVMCQGEVVEQGPVGDILRDPQTDYARMLIQAVPSLIPRPPKDVSDGAVVLETVQLNKMYGSSWTARGNIHAVRDATLALCRGETLGIVGESGSGKSTVARCVTRLIDPSSGSIRVDGRDIAKLSQRRLRPYRRRFQIVFQDPYRSLNPRRIIGDSIIEGPVNFGMSWAKAREKARELLDLVGVGASAIDRYPHQFSGGQRQRICIARALAVEPDLLIADEAVSALDVSVQAQVLALLEEIRQRFNLAMLFITHDLRVAAHLCDRVAVMSKGEIVEYGRAIDVLGNPRHEYTRSLIEAAPARDWDFKNFCPVSQSTAPVIE